VPRYALEILENRSSQDGKRKDKYLPDLPRAGEYDEDESRIHDESEELLLPAPPSRPTSWYRTASVQSTLDSTIRWVQGPHPPRPYTIERSFPQFQTTPIRLLDKYLRKQSHIMWSFGVLYLIWFIMFFFILRTSVAGAEISSHGPAVRLDCTSRLWWVPPAPFTISR